MPSIHWLLLVHWLALAFLTLMTLLSGPVWAADPAEADFKFLEMRQHLRDNATSDESLSERFAMGEYYFMAHMPEQAASYFKALKPGEPATPVEFLAIVYLLQCAQLAKDPQAALLEDQLKDAFSSKQFTALFYDVRSQSWKSPLGNRYDFHEEVDHMEIRLNGKPFYTVTLA